MNDTGEIHVALASPITDDSWLNEERFEEFRKGYEYACNQTMAISGLSRCTPEEMYYAYQAIQRGIERYQEKKASRDN